MPSQQLSVIAAADAARQVKGGSNGGGLLTGSPLLLRGDGGWNGQSNASTNFGVRFILVEPIPAGSVISNGALSWVILEGGATVRYAIGAERTSTGAFTASTDINGRAVGAVVVVKDVASAGFQQRTTVDGLTDIIQELLDAAGPNGLPEGFAITLIGVVDEAGSEPGYQAIGGFATDTSQRAMLEITWDDGSEPAPADAVSAAFDVSPLNGPLPLDVSLFATGQGQIAAWTIDWGDGSAIEQATTRPNPLTHTYAAQGPFTITVDVVGDQGQTARKTATVQPGQTQPGPAPATGDWPQNVELAIGETQNVFGKAVQLVSFQTLDTQHMYRATVSVGGALKTVIVGPGAVPISINGVRLLPYAWDGMVPPGKQLEQVSFQGGVPLSSGKTVGFKVTDATKAAYPAGEWWQDDEPNVNTYFQTFGEDNGATDIHSGFDIGSNRGSGINAPVAGSLGPKNTNYTTGYGEPDGGFQFLPDDPDIPPFIITHVNMNTVPPTGTHFEAGEHIAYGVALNPTPHNHIGSENHAAGNNVLHGAHLWNHGSRGRTRQSPRSWLVLGPFSGTVADGSLGFDESGDIASTFQPRAGSNTNGSSWKTIDNLFKATLRVDEAFTAQPYSGYRRPHGQGNRYGYALTYIWSDVRQTVTLRHGHSDQAVIWLNGRRYGSVIDSGRYNSYNLLDAPGILPQQFSVPVTLEPGFNTLLVKTQARQSSSRGWMLNVQIEGNSAPVDFSTRGVKVAASVGSNGVVDVTWTSLDEDLYRHADQYQLITDSTPQFNTPVSEIAPGGSSSRQLILPTGQHWIEVAPLNADQESASERFDAVQVNVTAGALDLVPPAQDPPEGLTVEETPLLVSFGFDDNWKPGAVDKLINEVFTPDLVNSDGSRVLASWYMIGENLDNSALNWEIIRLADEGHEIGNHGWWGLASGGPRGTVENWRQWITPTQQGLVALGIPAPVGYRAAQDEYDPAMHTVLKENGIRYSCSAQTCHSSNGDAENGYYPGTLEQGWPGNATWNQHDLGDHPGQWEVPQAYPDSEGRYCDTDWQDSPGGGTARAFFDTWRRHIARALAGNRAPVTICMHSQRYGPTNVGGADTGKEGISPDAWPVWRAEMRLFIQDMIAQHREVKFVRNRDIMDFMRDPAPIGAEPPPPATNSNPTLTANGSPQVSGRTVTVSFTPDDANPGDALSLMIDWGDQSNPEFISSIPKGVPLNRQHSYDADGNYTIAATLSDSEGSTASLTAPVSIDTAPPDDPNTIDITVAAASVVGSTGRNFSSAAIPEWMFPANGNQPYSGPGENQELKAAAKVAGLRTMRWGGGLWANAQGWTRDETEYERFGGTPFETFEDDDPQSLTFGQTHGYRHVYYPPMVRSLKRFKDEVGCDISIQVNILDNNPLKWADMVQYCNVELGAGFGIWELGNELDFVKPWGHNGSVAGHTAAAKEYVRRCVRYIQAMKAVDPTIKIMAGVTAHPSEGNASLPDVWHETMAAEFARLGVRPDFASYHQYANFNVTKNTPPDNNGDPDRGPNPWTIMEWNRYHPQSSQGTPLSPIPESGGPSWLFITRRKFFRTAYLRIKAYWDAAFPANPPQLAMTEERWTAGDGAQPVNEYPVHATWQVAVGSDLKALGLDTMIYYDLWEGQLPAGALGPGTVRTMFYPMVVLNDLSGDQILATSGAPEGYIAAASRDVRRGPNGEEVRTTWLTVCNDRDATMRNRIVVQGLPSADVTRAHIWRWRRTVDAGVVAKAGQVSLEGWEYNMVLDPDTNLDALYDSAQVMDLSGGPNVAVDIGPYDFTVIAFTNVDRIPRKPAPAPVPRATLSPLSGTAPHTVAFGQDASVGDISERRIDWGDGSPIVSLAGETSTEGLSHTYQDGGSYTVTLTLEGPQGQTDIQTFTVEVDGAPPPRPVPDFEWEQPQPTDPLLVRLRYTGTPTSGLIQWRADGKQLPETGPDVLVRFAQGGTYRVTVLVQISPTTFVQGPIVDVTLEVPVEPVAFFNVVPLEGQRRGIKIVDQSQNGIAWLYDFGDGSTSGAQSPTHVYAEDGTYVIEQTVTSSTGDEAKYRHTLTIQTEPGGNSTLIVGSVLTGLWLLGSAKQG